MVWEQLMKYKSSPAGGCAGLRGSRNIGESRSARRLDEPLLWYGRLGHLVSLLVGFTQSYVQRMRESRLWFTQTMREFRRACGKNLPHGLHGEGIVEAKTTEGLMPAHRPCLRAVAEQNSGRFLNRRPERSTLTFMLLDALEAPTEATPARHRRKRRTTP